MSKAKCRPIWIVAAGIVGCLAGSLIYFNAFNSDDTTPRFATPAAAQTWQGAQPYFKTADDETTAAMEHGLERLHDYFNEVASDGCLNDFADEALGWTAKFKLITDGQTHFNTYITERFQSLVFSENDLNALLAEMISGYEHDIDAADNKLLLSIKTDTETQATGLATSLPSLEQIHERFADVVSAAESTSAADLPKALARETTTIIIGEVLTQCAAEALTSAGILGTGTASGAATFGVGILAGIAVDFVVQKVTAPQEHLADELRGKVIGVRDSALSSARAYLEELGRQRATARKQVVVQALGGSL